MKQYVVIGMGQFGQNLALELIRMGHEVLGVDINENNLVPVQDSITHVLVADATSEEAIEALGIENFDCAVITIGNNMEDSVLAALNCKELGINAVWAKAASKMHAKVLKKIGVDRVIIPEMEMGMRTAHLLDSKNILDYISLSKEFQLLEVVASDEWINKTLCELNFREKYGVTVVAARNKENLDISPNANYKICPGDVLILVGRTEDINKL